MLDWSQTAAQRLADLKYYIASGRESEQANGFATLIAACVCNLSNRAQPLGLDEGRALILWLNKLENIRQARFNSSLLRDPDFIIAETDRNLSAMHRIITLKLQNLITDMGVLNGASSSEDFNSSVSIESLSIYEYIEVYVQKVMYFAKDSAGPHP